MARSVRRRSNKRRGGGGQDGVELLLHITDVDAEGRGVARHEGKVIFVDGAITGERVRAKLYASGEHFDQAETVAVERPSPWRAEPPCPYFGLCGGCSIQHIEPRAQVAFKQRVLEETLARVGKVVPEQVFPPTAGPFHGYRGRARLSVRQPRNKGVLVGFRERRSSYVADMQACTVLDPRVSCLLLPLRELVAGLSQPDRLPQIEVAATPQAVALVFRHLFPFTDDDLSLLADFARTHDVRVYGQEKGPTTVKPLYPENPPELFYRLPDCNVELEFSPTGFIQVNQLMNQALVHRAISLLDPKPGEKVLDLFCGLGNFSLPIAKRGAEVLGVEGDSGLTGLAEHNARKNHLAHLARFQAADLTALDATSIRAWGQRHKALLDPPRTGAIDIIKLLPEIGVSHMVYVSCNPATLARDAELLVHKLGFRLRGAGVFNMFPHTAHVESVALFTKD